MNIFVNVHSAVGKVMGCLKKNLLVEVKTLNFKIRNLERNAFAKYIFFFFKNK